jgi:6-phosphogluconate dehydrogenase
MTRLSDLGVLGLAVMGANLARNAARKGFGVALYNRAAGPTISSEISVTRDALRRPRI